MADTEKREIGAVCVPDWVANRWAYAARAARRRVEELCLHETPQAHSTWVCVLDADHEGDHG